MLSRLNLCVNSQTPLASKNKRHKSYFLPHVVTVALSSSKILMVGKLHWSLAIRMTTKTLMKQTSFAVKLSKYFKNTHFFLITHLQPPSPKRPVAETAVPNCPRPNFACTLLYTGRFLLTWPVPLRYQSLCSLVPAYLQGMSSHHFLFNFLGFL